MVNQRARSSRYQIVMEDDLVLSTQEAMSMEAFEQFCAQNPDLRVEREASGKLTIMAPVHFDSGYYEGEVFGELRQFVKKAGLSGRTFGSSTGFTLPDGSTKSPDAAWISAEKLANLPAAERKKFAAIVPDFVIEVRSDSDQLKALQQKMTQTWIANGVRLAWLIDPIQQKAYIYRQDGSMEMVPHFDGKLLGEDVLPGFELDLAILKA